MYDDGQCFKHPGLASQLNVQSSTNFQMHSEGLKLIVKGSVKLNFYKAKFPGCLASLPK